MDEKFVKAATISDKYLLDNFQEIIILNIYKIKRYFILNIIQSLFSTYCKQQ